MASMKSQKTINFHPSDSRGLGFTEKMVESSSTTTHLRVPTSLSLSLSLPLPPSLLLCFSPSTYLPMQNSQNKLSSTIAVSIAPVTLPKALAAARTSSHWTSRCCRATSISGDTEV